MKSNTQLRDFLSSQKFPLLALLSGREFQIAPLALPAYSNWLMGQQHRVTVKRKRRKAYVERKRAAAKVPRPTAGKPRSKKPATAAGS
jgi:hypothetical protein